MKYGISSITNKFLKPGEFFRYGTPKKRNVYHQLSRVLRRKIMNERSVEKHTQLHSSIQINEHMGYLRVNEFQRLEVILNAIQEATSDLNIHNEGVFESQQKKYLQNVRVQKEINLEHAYIRLALSPEILSIVIPYMNYVPIISDIQLWHSPNKAESSEGSQFFHLDYADVKQVKVFLLIEEVNDEMGPTTLVDAKTSQNICNKINYKLSNKDIRIPDEIVSKYCLPNQLIKATGSSGTIFFADTSRCLHYGSRNGSKPRNVLMIQYVSPFSFRYSLNFKKDAKFSKLIKPSLSNLDRLLLGDINI
jgi:hypothetical protein